MRRDVRRPAQHPRAVATPEQLAAVRARIDRARLAGARDGRDIFTEFPAFAEAVAALPDLEPAYAVNVELRELLFGALDDAGAELVDLW